MDTSKDTGSQTAGSQTVRIVVSWAVVSIPLLYALYQTGRQLGPLLGIGG